MSSGDVTGRFVLLIVLVAAIIWFAGLGYRDLIEPVCGEMLLRLLRATGIIRGSEISTGIG